MFFQRKNSKKVKDTDASSPKKEKSSRGKNDFLGGLGALAGGLKSAKNDMEERAEKVQEDVKAGIETILQRGSVTLEKGEEDIGDHSEVSRSNELGQGSEEEQGKDMDALSSILDKAKTNPDVMEKVHSVLDKVKSHPEVMEKVADIFHLGKHESKEKEPEAEEKTKEGETSADKTEDSNILEQAVEEIQAVVAAAQPQETARDETEVPVETAAETETPAEGEKPDEVKREVEKDNPKNRIDLVGFFAKLFEKFCSPADKKKD
ncbi:unnamed protein product [Alopecurus aequalis]